MDGPPCGSIEPVEVDKALMPSDECTQAKAQVEVSPGWCCQEEFPLAPGEAEEGSGGAAIGEERKPHTPVMASSSDRKDEPAMNKACVNMDGHAASRCALAGVFGHESAPDHRGKKSGNKDKRTSAKHAGDSGKRDWHWHAAC